MTLAKLDRRWYELFILVVLAAITTPIFWLTDADKVAAAWFYRLDGSEVLWPWQHWWLWEWLFKYAPSFTVIGACVALVIALLAQWRLNLKKLQRPALFIMLVIVLGPGMVVNLIFKDHWGRPRPLHITEFGGSYQYVPPLQIGPTEDKSFPCGHCSVGYMFIALYFLSRKRKAFYFALTLVFGLTMGVTRMSAGGHFVSDILWSGYLVFLTGWLLYYGWYCRREAA